MTGDLGPPGRERPGPTPETGPIQKSADTTDKTKITAQPRYFHAGGLRYHGMAPLVSLLQELGLIQSRALTQNSCFEAGIQFARTEGILPAPEANHAVCGTIDEALRCKAEGIGRTILFNLCGHGHFDMRAISSTVLGCSPTMPMTRPSSAPRLPTSLNLSPNSTLTGR